MAMKKPEVQVAGVRAWSPQPRAAPGQQEQADWGTEMDDGGGVQGKGKVPKTP